ncbi:MAG: hypothetical protein FWE31_04845 [Firmicutes bacterium]|nr:hypothetical protein [Bacillota bacterium]
MAKLVQIRDHYLKYLGKRNSVEAAKIAQNKASGGSKHTRPYLPLFDLSQIQIDLDIDFQGVEPSDIVYHVPLGHTLGDPTLYPYTCEIPSYQEGKRAHIDFRNMLPIKSNVGLVTWHNDHLKWASEGAEKHREELAIVEAFLSENMEEYIEMAKRLRTEYAEGSLTMSHNQMRRLLPFPEFEQYAIEFTSAGKGLSKKDYKHRDKERGKDSYIYTQQKGRKQQRRQGRIDRASKYGDQVFYEDMMELDDLEF